MASSTFKSLTDTTFDSVEGYRKAADKAKSAALKSALQDRLEQREKTLERLNFHLQSEGDELVTQGTVTGAAHRLWTEISNLFENGDEAAAERVEEGEDYIAGKFKAALEQGNLNSIERTIVEECYAEIRAGERFGDMIAHEYD